MIIYYLYVKTHKITGLSYLGQITQKDPHKYTGSGVYWLSHLEKHGYNYDTKILQRCLSKNALKSWGLYYSKLWSVTKSKKWANLKDECGDGGGCYGETNGMYGKTHSDEVKEQAAIAASIRFGGKSYEELYGKEKSDRMKAQRSRRAKGKDHSGTNNPRSKTYEIISPSGDKFIISGGVKKFCIENKLHTGSMIDVAKGRTQHYKNWTCKYI